MIGALGAKEEVSMPPTGLQISLKGAYVTENYFSYFSTKTYVADTQKNYLNEIALLSTHSAY